MSDTEERVSRLEKAFATLAELASEQSRHVNDDQRRIERVEESFVMLVEMTRRHPETLDELKAAQAESERKIAALADAQIRTEEALAQLTRKVDSLADSQAHADQRLDAIIDIVRDKRDDESQA